MTGRLSELTDAAPLAALRTFAGATATGQVASYLTAVNALRADGLAIAEEADEAHDLSHPHLWLARLASVTAHAHEAQIVMWTAWRRERIVWGVVGLSLGVVAASVALLFTVATIITVAAVLLLT